MYCTVLCTVLYCTVQVGTGVALDVAGAGLEVGVGVGGAALDVAGAGLEVGVGVGGAALG